MRSSVVVAFVVLIGCHKQASSPEPGAPASTAAADALWSLAPDGATVGVVASPRAIAMLEHAWGDVHGFLRGVPEAAEVAHKLEQQLVAATGVADPKLSDLGLSSAKGAALFVLGGHEEIFVIPLGDREKLLATLHGTKGASADTIGSHTCKTVNNVYACASSDALFARMGKGTIKAKLAALDARGDIELVAEVPTGPTPATFTIALQLARGGGTIRGLITGVPALVSKNFGAPTKPRTAADHTAGFGLVDLRPLIKELPPEPIAPGVTLADLAHSVGGPLTLVVPSGALALDARLSLGDPAPAKTIVEHCQELPPLAMLGAKVVDGKCHVTIPNIGIEVVVSVEGQELRIGTNGTAGGDAVAMTAAGRELAESAWSFALWGRGTLFGAPTFPNLPTQQFPPEAALAVRAMAMLNELGLGVRVEGDTMRIVGTVRTAWSNPDDVVAKLVAINPADVLSGKTATVAKAIADGAPGSPFAADLKSGVSGLMMPVGLVGMLAAIAIPAFMDYTKKAKKVESMIELNRLGKASKIAYAENGAFPIGTVALTPPAPCCAGKDLRCVADWSDPLWKKLDFSIEEPHLFQYSYRSDGKTFTALAVGDLDCDGTMITYEMRGDAANGNPTITIIEPPPGSD